MARTRVWVVVLVVLLLALSTLLVLPFVGSQVGGLIGDVLCALPSEGDTDPAVSRDGKSISFIHYDASGCLWESPRSEIYVSSEGREPKRITTLDDSARLLSWSPDGARIALSYGTSPEGIYVVNADGRGLKWLNPEGGSKEAPSWSPDGKTIAYGHYGGIYTMDVEGGASRLLIPDGEFPAWSPDGSQIAYVSNDRVLVFDLAEGSHRTVASGQSFPERPSWSPDGKRLAFAAAAPATDGDRWERLEIYSTNVDGIGFRTLTNNHVLDRSPAWTPDGMIVFESERGGASQIYIMNADGTGVRKLFRRVDTPRHRLRPCITSASRGQPLTPLGGTTYDAEPHG